MCTESSRLSFTDNYFIEYGPGAITNLIGAARRPKAHSPIRMLSGHLIDAIAGERELIVVACRVFFLTPSRASEKYRTGNFAFKNFKDKRNCME